MAVLDICIHPHPTLRETAAPIEKVDDGICQLIDNMAETMYKAPGIGLAANQVGRAIRLVVIDLQKPEHQTGLIVLVNPKIVHAEGKLTFEEGCLSIPEYYADVKRHEAVVVEGYDKQEKPVRIETSGILAVVLQHELDHLEGTLFIDHMGPIKRDIFRRKWKKRQQEAVA